MVVFHRIETLWEKKKMLVTSTFFFSHNVFKRLFPRLRQKSSLCGKGLIDVHVKSNFFSKLYYFWLPLNPFPNKPWFLYVCSTSHFKTLWEKEKLLITSNFSFSHIFFYPFGKLSAIFIKFKIAICKIFQFGTVLNLTYGTGLNGNPLILCFHISLILMNMRKNTFENIVGKGNMMVL